MNDSALPVDRIEENGRDMTKLIHADKDDHGRFGRVLVTKANCYNT